MSAARPRALPVRPTASPSAAPGGPALRWRRRACRCRGTTRPTSRRWLPAARSTGRRRGSAASATRSRRRRRARGRRRVRGPATAASPESTGPNSARWDPCRGAKACTRPWRRRRRAGRGAIVEALGDRPVGRVDLEREVRREHHRRVPPGRVVRVRDGALGRPGPSGSTASPRRGSSSAPSRTRRGSRGSRCPSSLKAPSVPRALEAAGCLICLL